MESEREYQHYIDRSTASDHAQEAEILQHIEIMDPRPIFVVLVDEDGPDDLAEETIKSCNAQKFRANAILRKKIEVASIDPQNTFLLWLKAGDRLHPFALYEYASLICAEPELRMIYCDDDEMRSDGSRTAPFIKPDWSPDYLESFDYIRNTGCYALELAKELLPLSASAYDLVLRFTEQTNLIGHIKKILLHHPEDQNKDGGADVLKDLHALKGRLERTGRRGQVSPSEPAKGCYKIDVSLKSNPMISVVIPTAGFSKDVGQQAQRDLIVQCVRSIVERSTYANYEIIVVHNPDFDRNRLAAFSSRVRFVIYGDREINIAKKLNMGAACAEGEILLLMNDDTEVITANWMEIMLAHFEKAHVGVVGSRLLYPDMTIQHAGVVSINGQPIHIDRSNERYDPGYYFSNAAPRNFSAVTGAVTMTRARFYQGVGGYTEEMPLYYNDIDFCYKIRDVGLSVVYDPNVELIHFESLSWTGSDRDEHRDDFFVRWGEQIIDPYYNNALLNSDFPCFAFSDNRRLF